MMNFSKTIWLSILLVIFFLTAGFFTYQWWQVKGELPRQLGVTIATDKTEYQQGEIIKIIVRNNLDKSIWYMKEMCPPSCCLLYKWENNEWKFVGIPFACFVFTGPGGIGELDKLKPGEEIRKEWNTKEDEFAEPGTYRFSFYYFLYRLIKYSKENIIYSYSNEFIIK